MSTTRRKSFKASNQIEILHNDADDTVTYVADHDPDGTVPPTEWITVDTGDLVDLLEYQ